MYWGKTYRDASGRELPGISVREHCLNVGLVAGELVQALPAAVRELLPEGATTLAALHDLGKISAGFQRKSPMWLVQNNLQEAALQEFWQGAESDHSIVSQYCLQQLLKHQRTDLWAVAVGAHHGRIHGRRINHLNVAPARAAQEEAARQELAEELLRLFGTLPGRKPSADNADLWLLAGLIAVADWIGSNERFFSPVKGLPLEKAKKQAVASLESIHWTGGRLRPGRRFQELFGIEQGPNALQAALEESVSRPGLFIVEGPMGCGKTEAALAAAYRLITGEQNQGLYFGLPTQVTSNRIHRRVGRFLENALAETANFRLAHGASWLDENQTLEVRPNAAVDPESVQSAAETRSWFASSRHAMLARYGVGTVDQALQGVVAVKHFFVRRFGLAGKVVILDEVHSYDVYTGALITELIRELLALRCSVIVLSATLTQARRQELLTAAGNEDQASVDAAATASSNAYPLITCKVTGETVRQVGLTWNQKKEIRLQVQALDEADIVEECLRRAEAGQHVLYLCNTVAEAQASYRAFATAMREGSVCLGLLHSRFPFFRREQLEEEWLQRLGKNRSQDGSGSILVATQVVEQSVDIDLDFIVSDLAPTDMLLQRMGRLWRHPRPERKATEPEFWINAPAWDSQAPVGQIKAAFGKTGRVYAPYVLARTAEIFAGRQTIIIPAQIREVLEATYQERAPETEPPGLQELRQELERERAQLQAEASAATRVLGNPTQADREEALTRRAGAPTRPLVLLRDCESVGDRIWRLSGLDGTGVEVSGREWSYAAACLLHRNLARVPAYFVPRQAPPEWLALHVPGQPAWALVQEDGRCLVGEADEPGGLRYQAALGVYMDSIQPRTQNWEEDDEFDQ